MMVEFRWIQMSLFLIVVLQFTAAGEKHFSSFTVRVGDDVTLPCGNVIDGQQQCENTTWIFSGSGNTAAVELIKLGKIGESVKSKSDRLSVTENCSLVIKNVTDEDVGRYDCQQYNSTGEKQGPDSEVHLSVITMTEQKNNDDMTLNCSVSTFEPCEHKVKWLFHGRDVDKDNKEMKTSQSVCSASVKFLTFHHIHTSRFNFLKCEVTDGDKVQQFPFRLGPSGEKPGDDTKTTTTTSTTQSTTKSTVSTTTTTTTELKGDTQTTTTESTRTTEKIQKSVTNTTAGSDSSTEQQDWWWVYMIVAMVSAVLLILVVIRWRRAKGKNTQTDQNIGLSLKPAVAPETSQDTAEPDGGVSYASISYTRTPKSKAQVLGKDGDDDEALTYSTVKAPSSAGASADPSSFYSFINKPME